MTEKIAAKLCEECLQPMVEDGPLCFRCQCLKDVEVKNRQLYNALRRACLRLAIRSHFCPLDAKVKGWEKTCNKDNCDDNGAECWVKYFLAMGERGGKQ